MKPQQNEYHSTQQLTQKLKIPRSNIIAHNCAMRILKTSKLDETIEVSEETFKSLKSQNIIDESNLTQ